MLSYNTYMKVIKVSELRQNLQDVVDGIYYTKKPVVVLRRGKPRVIITPLPESTKEIEIAIKEYEKKAKELLTDKK